MRQPVRLPANQPPRFYRGGAAIADLRGPSDARTDHGPEDWVASTTTLHGEPADGLSALPEGGLLRDAIRADPHGWLGAAHATRFGADPALLVKLLDAGQRLPVHCHPNDEFAGAHFHSRYGKSEAWIVVGTSGEAPTVHIGFKEDRDADTIADWVARQDADTMLRALNEVTVAPGDTVFIPAGLPHAIGAGVFIVELQQPTDLSVTLEWRGFLDDEAAAHLGVGYPTALRCVDRSGWDADRLASIVRRAPAGADPAEPVTDLLSPAASGFFRAQRVTSGRELAPSFAVLVALGGEGSLRTEHGGDMPLGRGDTVVVPHAAGASELTGDVVAIRCLPPGSPPA